MDLQTCSQQAHKDKVGNLSLAKGCWLPWRRTAKPFISFWHLYPKTAQQKVKKYHIRYPATLHRYIGTVLHPTEHVRATTWSTFVTTDLAVNVPRLQGFTDETVKDRCSRFLWSRDRLQHVEHVWLTVNNSTSRSAALCLNAAATSSVWPFRSNPLRMATACSWPIFNFIF